MTGQATPYNQVTPYFGQPGTIFHFVAEYFDPHKEMKILINDPNNRQIYNQDFVTNNQGDIDVEIRTTRDWLIGEYTLTAIGKYEGKKYTMQRRFELTN